MTTPESFAALSENEHIIQSYRCTKLRQFFAKPHIGYLSVTNKRLVYHSEGKVFGGNNAIISEIPLNDVGGISTQIGKSINILHFLLMSMVLYFATSILKNLLPEFLTGWVISIIFIVPYLIGTLFEKNILNKELGEKILKNLEGTSLDTLLKKKKNTFYMSIFRILFLIGLAFFAWNLIFETSVARQGAFFGYIAMLVAYFIIYMLLLGSYRSFGLQVSSKASGNPGITIRGGSFTSFINKNVTATKEFNASPAEEAEIVAKDLGAIILDIQQMGDLGIEKWSPR